MPLIGLGAAPPLASCSHMVPHSHGAGARLQCSDKRRPADWATSGPGAAALVPVALMTVGLLAGLALSSPWPARLLHAPPVRGALPHAMPRYAPAAPAPAAARRVALRGAGPLSGPSAAVRPPRSAPRTVGPPGGPHAWPALLVAVPGAALAALGAAWARRRRHGPAERTALTERASAVPGPGVGAAPAVVALLPLTGTRAVPFADWRPRLDERVAADLRVGFGARWPDVVQSLKEPAALGLRVNLSAASREAMRGRLAALGIATTPCAQLGDMLKAEPRAPGRAAPDPPDAAEVVVGRLCGEAVLNGAHVYGPGVLACTRDLAAGDAVRLSVDVDGRDTVGTPVDELRGRRVVVGAGVARLDRKAMLSHAAGLAVDVGDLVTAVPPAVNGRVPLRALYTQGLAPAAVGHVLDPVEHRNVVDLCAAPGGKATHVAARLLERARDGAPCVVVACDRSAARLDRLRQTAAAWGQAGIVRCVCGDGAALPKPEGLTPADALVGGEAWDAVQARGLRAGHWDAVLVDPPCSALGLRPRLSHWQTTPQHVRRLVKGQRRMVRAAAALLRPGGLLVYSTCTVTPQENEEVVAWAVRELGLRLRDAHPGLGGPAWAGHGLPDAALGCCRRADPVGETAGFFLAALVKPR